MIDHIGGKRISIRHSDSEIVIRLLDRESPEFRLTSEEWFELIGLIQAIKAHTDFMAEYL